MKVIKNINNNVSLCVDSNGCQVIAFGKGIGFDKPPYDVPLHLIERTFYNISDIDYNGIKNLTPNVIKAAIRIVDKAEQHLGVTLMSTAILALADHIQFAIKRKHDQMVIPLPLQEDIKQLHPVEMKQAYEALKIIEEETSVLLDRSEASNIALLLVNNQMQMKEDKLGVSHHILDEAILIIEQEYHILINRDSFNYSRFATHMYYLVNRVFNSEMISSVNAKMFEDLKTQYASAHICAIRISEIFKDKINQVLSDEEIIYLILHINRLCSREELSK